MSRPLFNHVAVTTFSQEGYDLYGKKMLESFLEHWNIPIVVAHESQEDHLQDPRVIWSNVLMDGARAQWMNQYDVTKYRGTPNNPNMQAVRFSHKIWAVTGWRPSCNWWIWIDADVLWTRDVDEDVLARWLPDDHCLSYLGREGLMRPGQVAYTEASFIGYKVRDIRVESMLDDMRHVYTSGELFHLGENNWHDSYVFDHCRARSGIRAQEQHNLSKGVKGLHVWPKSQLGRYGTHQKGPNRKIQTYGGIVD